MFAHDLGSKRVTCDDAITCPLQKEEWHNLQFV